MKMKRTLQLLIIGTIFVQCAKKKTVQVVENKIPVYEVQTDSVTVYTEFIGQTYGLFDIAIRARVDGFLDGIHFNEGGHVKKGQLLYTIDPAPFNAMEAEALSKVAEAKTRLVKAQSDYERYKPLVENNAVSKSDYDAAVANLGAAKAAVEAANASLAYAKIQKGYTSILSPIDGIIGRSAAKVSDYVGREPNPVVLNTVSNLDTILVRFHLTEMQYLALSKHQATVNDMKKEPQYRKRSISLYFADGSVHPYKGHADFISRAIDPTTGTLLVQASFPNPDETIRPGQFAKVKVQLKTVPDAILIPKKCIVETQGEYSVFIVKSDGTVEQKAIEIYSDEIDMSIIKSGLSKGDKIVLEGLSQLKTGVKIAPVITPFESVRKTKQ